MTKLATQMLYIIGGSVFVIALAKGVELVGPLGIRRIKLIASLVFVLGVLALTDLFLWQSSWWEGFGFGTLMVVCAIAGWRGNRFGEIRAEWAGEDPWWT